MYYLIVITAVRTESMRSNKNNEGKIKHLGHLRFPSSPCIYITKFGYSSVAWRSQRIT